MATPTKISYVLITQNRIKELTSCLLSIQKQDYPNIEIVVVDNNSSDHTSETIKREFPNILLRSCEKNHGVPEARNLGVMKSTGEIIIFVDDDTIITDRQLTSKVVKFFEEQTNVHILAFKIINFDRNKVLSADFPHWNLGKIDEEFQTSYFMGGGNAIRSEVFRDVGGFYKDYFFNLEEIDFAWRAIIKDYQIVYSGDISIYHLASPTSRPSWRKVYFTTRNRIWLVFSFLPFPYIITHLAVWLPYFFIQALIIENLPAYMRAITDGFRNCGRLRSRRSELKFDRQMLKKLRRLHGRLFY